MSEGFDYEAHRKIQQLGQRADQALIVSFEYQPEKLRDGTFKNVEFIRIWIDKNQEIVRKVTPEDKLRFDERYDAFRKGEEMPPSGTPIAQCAFATPADVSACKAERIFTLEQLVVFAPTRSARTRPWPRS